MTTDKKDLTEDEKFELQLQAEQEFGRLARTFTILDRNRAQFGDTGGKLAKQERVLNIFQKEQNNILTDLAVASAPARKKEDEKRSNELSSLLNEYDDFDREIRIQKSHLNEIDGQIQMVKKKVLDLGSKQITDEKYHQRVLAGEKTVQTLENKLEVQIRKFCAISAENFQLRQKINHLLIERNEFNKIWDTLINNLCVGKKFMLDLIEQATIAYDQREEWVSKLQFLRIKAHNDLVNHIQEMRVLIRKKDNFAKLQEFYSIKGQKRIMKDLEKKQVKKRQIHKDKMEKRLEKYLQIMLMIKEFTCEDRIHSVAKKFINQEEENFGMFKYINHLNKEMEELSDHLGKLHQDIDEQNALDAMRRVQQEEKIFSLRKKFKDAEQETNIKSEILKQVDGELVEIMKGIGTLFKMFKCKNDPLIQLLGHNETINYYNVGLYLEILEKNIQEVFVSIYHKEKILVDRRKLKSDQMTIEDTKHTPSLEPIEKIVTTNPCPLCVEHELVNDVIDILQTPYTKKYVQVKLRQKIAREGIEDKLHNVSACHLPKSRQIIQKRYQ